MAAMYHTRPDDPFEDTLISPTQALFPPELFAKGSSIPTLPPVPPHGAGTGSGHPYNKYHQHRDSISATSDFSGTGQMDDDDFAAFQNSLLSGSRSGQGSISSHSQHTHSRLPSLSPSNGSTGYLSSNSFGLNPNLSLTGGGNGHGNTQVPGLSPQSHSLSSASPRSTISGPTSISTGIADEFIFGNPLAQDELDQLLYQDSGVMPAFGDSKGAGNGNAGVSGDQSIFHLPGWSFPYTSLDSVPQFGNDGSDGGFFQPYLGGDFSGANSSNTFSFGNMTSPKSNPNPMNHFQLGGGGVGGGAASINGADGSAEAMRKVAEQANLARAAANKELEEVRRQQMFQAQQIEALQRQQQQNQQNQQQGASGPQQLQTIPPSWMNRGASQPGHGGQAPAIASRK